MDVRPVDPFDDELLGRYQDLCRQAELYERPWESIWSHAELRARFEHPKDTEHLELFATFDGDEMLAGGFLEVPLEDNLDKGFVHVMVPPAHRRRGVGTLLLGHLAEAVRAHERTELLVETSYSFGDRHDHPYRRFAEKNGFQEVNVEVVRVLPLPVDDELLDRLGSEAAPHHEGYRVETIVGEVPDAYLPSYCRLHNQLGVDAPTGDVDFEEESLTPETFRETEKRFAAAGTTRVSTVALLGDAEVVAYTDLVVRAEETERANQWGTLVHRDHRGHRLGTAVKVANLRELRGRFPERSEVVTSNAEVNQNMVDINDRLGFTPVAVLPMFRRFL